MVQLQARQPQLLGREETKKNKRGQGSAEKR